MTVQARIELGLLVAIMLPRTFPGLARKHLIGLLFTAAYGAYVVFPAISGWRSWTLWAIAISIATWRILFSGARQSADLSNPSTSGTLANQLHTELSTLFSATFGRASRRNVARLAGVAPIVTVAFLVLYGRHSGDVLHSFVKNSEVAVVISGLLAATFVGQEVVVPLVKPFAKALTDTNEDLPQIGHTSAYIGWVERALVFAFIAGGQPSAAALAITAKTLVRIPDLHTHPKAFVEYVLIGTFASLLTALTFAVLVRLALGLSPI